MGNLSVTTALTFCCTLSLVCAMDVDRLSNSTNDHRAYILEEPDSATFFIQYAEQC